MTGKLTEVDAKVVGLASISGDAMNQTKASTAEADQRSESIRVAGNKLQEQMQEGLTRIAAAQASADDPNKISAASTQDTLAKLLQL